MDNMEVLATTGAVIVMCVLLITKTLLDWRGSSKARKLMELMPYAFTAFSWVEKNIPDDYGVNSSDPAFCRAMHKLDVFAQRFVEFSKAATGKEPTVEMIAKAKVLASRLAEERKKAQK